METVISKMYIDKAVKGYKSRMKKRKI